MNTQRFSVDCRFSWKQISWIVRRCLPGNKTNIENVLTGEQRTVEGYELAIALFAHELAFDDLENATGNSTEAPPKPKIRELSDHSDLQQRAAHYRFAILQPLLDLGKLQRAEIAAYIVMLKLIRTNDATREDVAALVSSFYAKRGMSVRSENLDKYVSDLFLTRPLEVSKNGLDAALSRASIYRWLNSSRQTDFDIRAQIPKTDLHKKGSPLAAEINAIIDQSLKDIYLPGPNSPSAKEIGQHVAARLDELNISRSDKNKFKYPSTRTINRRIKKLDPFTVLSAKFGERIARKMLRQYGQMDYPILPLEEVELDDTDLDIIVLDDKDDLPLGRPHITCIKDRCTRLPTVFKPTFETISFATVKEALYDSILPKPDARALYGTDHDFQIYGLMTTLVIDNALQLTGYDLQDACLSLGVFVEPGNIETPTDKAGIEGSFNVLEADLIHGLPGSTFSSPQKRGKYDSYEYSCLYLSELERILHIYFLDIYAPDAHDGPNGTKFIPSMLWEEAQQNHDFFPRLAMNPDELRILLGRVVWRTIGHAGIEIEYLRYNCKELGPLRARLARDRERVRDQPGMRIPGALIKCKTYPDDLSRIDVYDPYEKTYIPVPALAQEYTKNLSLWKHRVIVNMARQMTAKVDIAALGRARRKIQDIVDAARNRVKLSGRKRIAQWDHKSPQSTSNTEQKQITAAVKSGDESPSDSTPTLHDKLLQAINEASDEGWEISPYLPQIPEAQMTESEDAPN
jgi:putative transposase